MEEKPIEFKTAKLSKDKGFDCIVNWSYDTTDNNLLEYSIRSYDYNGLNQGDVSAPTQSILQKWIRETRGVHIEIHRNASGYFWSMCKEDGGTDLGWSDHTGPNLSGVWDKFEGALENALQIQLSYDLPSDLKVIKHWGNYVDYILKINKIK